MGDPIRNAFPTELLGYLEIRRGKVDHLALFVLSVASVEATKIVAEAAPEREAKHGVA